MEEKNCAVPGRVKTNSLRTTLWARNMRPRAIRSSEVARRSREV
jgi:hypothetical protein